MNRHVSSLKKLGLLSGPLVLMAIFETTALGQGQTFVSVTGSDANNCTVQTSPCRSVGKALTLTSAGGKVFIEDTGVYAPFTISESVTVEAAPGVTAAVTATTGNGVYVNASATAVVTLKGLTVNYQGSPSGLSGILFLSGGTLHIEDCIADGFGSAASETGAGIAVMAPGIISIKDTIARNNLYGIFVAPDVAGTVSLTMDRVRSDGNTDRGLFVSVGTTGFAVNAAIRDSSFSNNEIGIVSFAGPGTALLNFERCLISNNQPGAVSDFAEGTGIALGISAQASISNCAITGNTAAASTTLSIPGSPAPVIYSRGNNTLIGNGTNGAALTPFAAQ